LFTYLLDLNETNQYIYVAGDIAQRHEIDGLINNSLIIDVKDNGVYRLHKLTN
jgi:hypothetical protein